VHKLKKLTIFFSIKFFLKTRTHYLQRGEERNTLIYDECCRETQPGPGELGVEMRGGGVNSSI
jgi:hypothetical protein